MGGVGVSPGSGICGGLADLIGAGCTAPAHAHIWNRKQRPQVTSLGDHGHAPTVVRCAGLVKAEGIPTCRPC